MAGVAIHAEYASCPKEVVVEERQARRYSLSAPRKLANDLTQASLPIIFYHIPTADFAQLWEYRKILSLTSHSLHRFNTCSTRPREA
jgi:hypothetical protein